MSTIVTRAGKGSALSWTEADDNFTNLNTDKVEAADVTTAISDAVGVSVQAYSANLDEYAAVNPTAAGLALLDDANAAAQRTTLGLVIGTDVQAYDATLTAFAGGLTAANKIPYATALNTLGELDLSTNTSLGTSDTTLSTQKAVKTYVDAQVAAAAGITLAAEVASTSGTAVDFTSIPAGVKRITILFKGVSTNGTSNYLVQIGDSGGVETAGYTSLAQVDYTATASNTTGFIITRAPGAAGNLLHGAVVLDLERSSTFSWNSTGVVYCSNAPEMNLSTGNKSLSAELDRVRITTVSGDTFDAGGISISYQ